MFAFIAGRKLENPKKNLCARTTTGNNWTSQNFSKRPRKRGNTVAETLLQKHVSLNVFPSASTLNICCENGNKKNFFFQKHLVSTTNVSPFARQRNNVDQIPGSGGLHFLNWTCANFVFSDQKCFLVCTAREHCFLLVCGPKTHSWKLCFRNNVSWGIELISV